MSTTPLPYVDEDVLRTMAEAAKLGSNEFLQNYVTQFRTLHQFYTNTRLRRGKYVTSQPATVLDTVKIGAILNDTTIITFRDYVEFVSKYIMPDEFRSLLGVPGIYINLPPDGYEDFERAASMGQVYPSFFFGDGKEIANLLTECSPLIGAGRLLFAPERHILYLHKEHEDGTRDWLAVEVPDESSIEAWDIPSEDAEKPIEMDITEKRREGENLLFDLMLPFVDGVSTSDLAAILNDEADVLDEFRAGIRDVISKATSDGVGVQELASDVLRPRIARLDRRFRHITNMNRLRIGGAIVGTATVGLASYFTTGLGTAITAVAGGSGLLLVAKEVVGAKSDQATLKDESMYLLWKLRR